MLGFGDPDSEKLCLIYIEFDSKFLMLFCLFPISNIVFFFFCNYRQVTFRHPSKRSCYRSICFDLESSTSR